MREQTYRKRTALAAILPTLLAFAACSDDPGPTGVGGAESLLLSVEPLGGAVGVDIGTAITITFDHPMDAGMSGFAALHEGDLDGPEVEGTWSWANSGTRLSFASASALKPATLYTVHLGGGMRDASGRQVNFEEHGPDMGGSWATPGMMGGDMPSGMGGPGAGHMGDGWRHPTNGTYGMVFSFTTG